MWFLALVHMKLPFHRRAKADQCRCPACKSALDVVAVWANLRVCPDCGHHFPMPCGERLASLFDDGEHEPLAVSTAEDPIQFHDVGPYSDRLALEREAVGLEEVAAGGWGKLRGRPLVIAATDLAFLRGSVKVTENELVAAAAEIAAERQWPLVVVANSAGGARIQEGAYALMQMAKTAAAVARLDAAGGLFVSVIASPTMGGVMASFAALGDVTLAEPEAVAGYTSSHLIQKTFKTDLPVGFQTAEYLLERGFIDAIVHRHRLPEHIDRVIGYGRSDLQAVPRNR